MKAHELLKHDSIVEGNEISTDKAGKAKCLK